MHAWMMHLQSSCEAKTLSLNIFQQAHPLTHFQVAILVDRADTNNHRLMVSASRIMLK